MTQKDQERITRLQHARLKRLRAIFDGHIVPRTIGFQFTRSPGECFETLTVVKQWWYE